MPLSILTQSFKTPFGELLMGSYDDQLCLCDWRYRKMRTAIDNRLQTQLQTNYQVGESPVLTAAQRQLNAYFEGKLKVFDLPLLCVGTDFQQTVWQALLEIPFGKTASYLELSQKLGNEKAIRAVATANGANAISIIVPCHRIIGSKGDLVGYAGGLPTKRKLLLLENALPIENQLTFF